LSDQFECLSETELQKLSSDDLIAYIRKAHDAGRSDCAQTALAMLCHRHMDDVMRRISIRVPPQDVEDTAMTVMLAALKSTFDGTSVGEFVNWLNRIVDRRGIVDYWRGREREVDRTALPSEHQGEEEIWGEEPGEEDETGKVLVESVADECLESLSEPHRMVIELNVYEDLDATVSADRVNHAHPDLEPAMNAANVHQIASRFRECLRKKLSDEDPNPD
jgi:RNA polymerase sigma factor (sigma-70 family)